MEAGEEVLHWLVRRVRRFLRGQHERPVVGGTGNDAQGAERPGRVNDSNDLSGGRRPNLPLHPREGVHGLAERNQREVVRRDAAECSAAGSSQAGGASCCLSRRLQSDGECRRSNQRDDRGGRGGCGEPGRQPGPPPQRVGPVWRAGFLSILKRRSPRGVCCLARPTFFARRCARPLRGGRPGAARATLTRPPRGGTSYFSTCASSSCASDWIRARWPGPRKDSAYSL